MLEAARVAYAAKKKKFHHFPESFQDFWSIADSVLNKGKSALPPLFYSMKALSSTSDKTKLFTKSFLITLKLMTQVFLYLFLILELILNGIISP